MSRPNNPRFLRRTILCIVALIALYVLTILIYGTVNDYRPEERISLEPFQNATNSLITDRVLSFTSWNLGFGGLGKESDFFYDDGYFFFSGGRVTRTPLSLVQKNVAGFLALVDSLPSDFYLFQEIDRNARRSHDLDQVAELATQLPDYSGVFAANFQVPYVPIPIFEPWHAYGEVYSGLANYSRYQATENTRLQLPGNFSWPKRVFSLDRCLSLQRFAVAGEKELVVVNVHNSAYDKGGVLKEQQLNYLQELLLKEYEKGNYVIAGGDWNMCPPYFRFDGFMPGRTQGYTQQNIRDDRFPADWLWVYDAALPTNRKTKTSFERGTTFVTLIDFYLVSPNIKVRKVKTVNLDFKFSDHQPVWMEVELLP